MDIRKTFELFCNRIRLKNTSRFDTSIFEIVKKLNKKYYLLEDDGSSNVLLVGSIGRKTAIKNVSDVDVIFSLPHEVYDKYDSYQGNGQSALLQEVKNELLTRYPTTEIHGDGQVVSIEFTDYTFELVPAFCQKDGTYKYPDSNDGGSWKITDPVSEQKVSRKKAFETQDNYIYMCNILRTWKNHLGFQFKGLLIDTFVFNYLSKNNVFVNSDFGQYIDFLTDVWLYLSQQDSEQTYWYALGSNQKIYNTDNGIFVKKARIAYSKIIAANSEEKRECVLKDLLGREFSQSLMQAKSAQTSACNSKELDATNERAPNERFIEDLFPVDIKWNLHIDCRISQNGFRPFWLSSLRGIHRWLSKNKTLSFQIISTDVPKPYKVFWKVRNRGAEAIRRHKERGDIILGGNTKNEHTDFSGEHYVECFIVKHDMCVARSKVLVPIDTEYIDLDHKA